MSPFSEDFMKQNYSEAGFKETAKRTQQPHFKKKTIKNGF